MTDKSFINRPNLECMDVGCPSAFNPTGRDCNDENCPQILPDQATGNEIGLTGIHSHKPSPTLVSHLCSCGSMDGTHKGCCRLAPGRAG